MARHGAAGTTGPSQRPGLSHPCRFQSSNPDPRYPVSSFLRNLFCWHIAKSVEQLACEHGPFLSPPMLIVRFVCCQVAWTVVARRLLCCHPDRLS